MLSTLTHCLLPGHLRPPAFKPANNRHISCTPTYGMQIASVQLRARSIFGVAQHLWSWLPLQPVSTATVLLTRRTCCLGSHEPLLLSCWPWKPCLWLSVCLGFTRPCWQFSPSTSAAGADGSCTVGKQTCHVMFGMSSTGQCVVSTVPTVPTVHHHLLLLAYASVWKAVMPAMHANAFHFIITFS